MKSMSFVKYVAAIAIYLFLLIIFQFACVTKLAPVTPGEELLDTILLMSKGEHEELLKNVNSLNLDSLPDKDSTRVAYIAGMAAVNIEDYEAADRYFTYCLKHDKILEDYYVYQLSVVYAKKGNYRGALDLGNMLIEKYPDSVWYEDETLRLGEYYVGLSQFEKATAIYDAFLKSNEKSKKYPEVLFLKANVFDKTGNKNEAIELYKKVWLEHPNDKLSGDAFLRLFELEGFSGVSERQLIRRAKLLYESNDFTGALRALSEIPGILNIASDRLSSRGEIDLLSVKCYYGKRQYKKAQDVLDRLIRDTNGISRAEILLWRAKLYDRLDDNDRAIATYFELFNTYPKNSLAEDALYLAARTGEEMGNYDDALKYYQLYLNTYSRGSMVKDVRWYIGWLYYRKGDYASALKHFSEYGEGEQNPQYLYWFARTLEKQGMTDDSIKKYQEITLRFPMSYYRYQAEARLTKLSVVFDSPVSKSGLDPNFWEGGVSGYDRLTSDDRITTHVKKAIELMSMNQGYDASRELDLIVNRCVGNPELLIEVARMFRYAGDYATPISIANTHFKAHLSEYRPGENDLYWQMKYPRGYRKDVESLCGEYGLEPAFVYSVIRAESLFKPSVSSWAGAMGLMQIIPETGKQIAHELGVDDFKVEDLLNYRINLQFGVYYLSQQLTAYNGEFIYALCAYNAGPGATKKWISGRNPEMEDDEFIENIPYPETRTYVKRILEYYNIYRTLYGSPNSKK